MLWFEDHNIAIFFSFKSDGDMLFHGTQINADLPPHQNLVWGQAQTDADELNDKVRANRIAFFKKHNIDPRRLINLAGIHGANIATIDHSDLGRGALYPSTRIPDTDGLISDIKNSYLMVTGADCFPVFFYDPEKRVVGIAHCGWRGILRGLPIKIIDKFISEFGSNSNDINIWIGPGVKSCHFEVQNDVAGLFEKNFKNAIINKDGGIFINLPEAIALPLIEAGIKPENITEHPDCTFCEKDKYFSYRRDRPKIIEASAFIIQLK